MHPPVVQQFPAGSCIFREGDPGDCGYLIEEGRVEIRVGGAEGAVVAVLEAGDVFGEMTLIDARPRSASAHALSACVLLPISRGLVQSKLANADPLTRLLVKLVLKRFRGTRGDAPSLEDDAAPAGHHSTLSLVAAELTLATDLRHALENKGLELHFQPILRLADRSLAGFEALARWNRAGAGYVPPSKFIAVAEDTDLVLPLGRWVLEEACLALPRLAAHAGRGTAPFMSVNLSGRQLHHSGEAQRLVEVIARTGTRHEQIKLEITETALISDPQTAARSMKVLREAGVTLAIDDFGTGYSSMSYLHRFPLQTLKIDRSFVDPLPADPIALRVTRAIRGLARELELDTVAEGIEDESQCETLREMGCELGQGYLFARPAPERDVIAWLEQRDAGNLGQRAGGAGASTA